MKKATSKRTEPVSLADEDQVQAVLSSAVLGIWDVVNGLGPRQI